MVLLIFIAFGIRTSWFQTFLAQQIASYLSNELNKEIKIDKVDLVFFDELDIEGVYVQDGYEDTLLYTKKLNATIADWKSIPLNLLLFLYRLTASHCKI